MKSYNHIDEFIFDCVQVGQKILYKGKRMVVKKVKHTCGKPYARDGISMVRVEHEIQLVDSDNKTVLLNSTSCYEIPGDRYR